MRDELYDLDYQDGRADLHDGIDRLLALIADGVRVTFAAIHRVEWSAPWKAAGEKDYSGLA